MFVWSRRLGIELNKCEKQKQQILVEDRTRERRMTFRRERMMGDAIIRYLQVLEQEERKGMAILSRKGQMLQVRIPSIFDV